MTFELNSTQGSACVCRPDLRGRLAVPALRLAVASFALSIAGAASAQEAFYQMNEASWLGAAPQVIDSTGNGNDGTAVGGANTVSDPTFGQVGSFDGNGQHVNVGGNFAMNGARSITAWVNVPAFGESRGMPIAVGGTSGAGDFFGIGGSGGENWNVPQYSLYVDHWGIQDYSSTGRVTPGRWNFVTLTYDGAHTVDFYINGAFAGDWVSQGLFSYNINSYTLGGSTIGGSTTLPSMTGDLRDVGIWTSQLTGAQVQGLYQAQGVPEPSSFAALALLGLPFLRRRRK